MLHRILIICAVLLAPVPVLGQNEQTLADIRQQLTALYGDVQRLRGELSASAGALPNPAAGSTPLDRLNAVETELQRLTALTEQLEFRVNRITVDGTNRIGDLEFRLCELEPACDIALLGDTPSLGGVDNSAGVPVAAPPPPTGGPAVAIAEQEDLNRASAALAAGDYRTAADSLASFSATYPGSPLAPQAALVRAQALDGLGETTNAARAYLESFSSDQTGPAAAQALFGLGAALGAIGQTQDACLTLAEVNVRFPADPAVAQAQTAMQNLGCQ